MLTDREFLEHLLSNCTTWAKSLRSDNAETDYEAQWNMGRAGAYERVAEIIQNHFEERKQKGELND